MSTISVNLSGILYVGTSCKPQFCQFMRILFNILIKERLNGKLILLLLLSSSSSPSSVYFSLYFCCKEHSVRLNQDILL